MAYLSRRNFIKTASAASVACAVPMVAQSAATLVKRERIPPPSGTCLTLLAVSEETNWPLLDKHFPGLRQHKKFSHLAKCSYLAVNVSGQKLRAFSIKWELDAPVLGNPVSVKHYYFRPSPHRKPEMHWGVSGNKTRFTAQVPVLRKDAVKLVSPYFACSPSRYKKSHLKTWKRILKSNQSVNFPVQPDRVGPGPKVRVATIDAVVSHGFYVLGPDSGGLSKIISTTRNAEHDEALAIYLMQQAGASRQAVKSVLRTHITGDRFDITPARDLYYRVRQRQARVLLRRLLHSSHDHFSKTVQCLVRKRKTIIQNA